MLSHANAHLVPNTTVSLYNSCLFDIFVVEYILSLLFTYVERCYIVIGG